MEKYQVIKAKDQNDLKRFYPVMKELRKDLALSDYLVICELAKATSGYGMVAIEENRQILAVMGYRVLYDFVHGKHLYIDDLVSTEAHRSQGLGSKLLNYAENLAKELGCKGLRLCTGIENELGKKFYEREGWNLRAVVYKKKLG